MNRLLFSTCLILATLLPMANATDDVTPKSAVAGATLNVIHEGSVKPGEQAYLKIAGLTLDEIQRAKKDGLFDLTVYPLKDVRVHASYDWLNDQLELVFQAKSPAEYLVKMHLVRDGKLEIAAIVVVVEGDVPLPPKPDPPKPDPPDPPKPGQKYQVMFFYETDDLDNMPMAQREMVTGLAFREALEAKGHRFMGAYDADTIVTVKQSCNGRTCTEVRSVAPALKEWWAAVDGDPLPRVAIAPLDGGDIKDFPLPAGRAELYLLMGDVP